MAPQHFWGLETLKTLFLLYFTLLTGMTQVSPYLKGFLNTNILFEPQFPFHGKEGKKLILFSFVLTLLKKISEMS